MHSNLNYAPPRKRPRATAGELLALQIAMCVTLVWVCVPLQESQPLIVGFMVGLYLWASFLVLRGLYRCPPDEPERRFGR
ncbi:MAG: hypothetical protein DI630_12530 [Gordonia sp. (in: high G+C Gram-positive bacteria)]|nr:MAG: hypothetical protein DI630_12530 [Gordonia sp. (in: high G+C Gram-positive bacteria)]